MKKEKLQECFQISQGEIAALNWIHVQGREFDRFSEFSILKSNFYQTSYDFRFAFDPL